MCGSATLMIEMSSDCMKVPSITEAAMTHLWLGCWGSSAAGATATAAEFAETSLMPPPAAAWRGGSTNSAELRIAKRWLAQRTTSVHYAANRNEAPPNLRHLFSRQV